VCGTPGLFSLSLPSLILHLHCCCPQPFSLPLSLPFLTAGAAPFQIPSSHL
jgi:hypothetical protein